MYSYNVVSSRLDVIIIMILFIDIYREVILLAVDASAVILLLLLKDFIFWVRI